MAAYTVCLNDAAINITVIMAKLNDNAPNFYTDYWGCSVEEQTADYRFTASAASDVPYTVWYSRDILHKQDNSTIYDNNDVKISFTFPAGLLTFDIHDIPTYIDKYCSDEVQGAGAFEAFQ